MVLAALALAGAGVAKAEDQNDVVIISGPLGTDGRKSVRPNWAEINRHPLGEKANPVRADRPPGQRAYLARLRCPDGSVPVGIERVGSFGPGPYTSIVDGYRLVCDGRERRIFMDMYHPGYVERRPVPGLRFTN
jgi:hypothetical protein